jgi:sigma-B regulation protein RsbU (phosphoserine phosphatase)
MPIGSLVYLLIIAGLVAWVVSLRRRERDLLVAVDKDHRERKTVFLFLNNLGERLTTSNIALEPALEIITDFIVEVTGAEAGAAFLLDPQDGCLSARVVHGMFPPLMPTTGYVLTKQKYLTERVKREKVPLGQGIIGEAAATGIPVLVSDAQNDPRVPKSALEFLTIQSIMVAPLKARGKISGVLAVVNKRNATAFTGEDLDLLLSLSDQAASTVELVKLYDELSEKQRMEQELRVAHDFQRMLLPRECPAIQGFEIAAFSAPAQEVGGDYYDFFYVDEDRRYLGVVIADVSGKGIPGALIMSMVRSTLRAEARASLSPREVLIRANERAYSDTKENVFITMTYGILDTHLRVFRFARAGHEPLVTLKRESENVRLTSPDGIALGMVGNDMFGMIEETTMHLDEGDMALMYTDGVVEAMDDKTNEYGQKRFFDFVISNRDLSPTEIIEKTLVDIESFTRGHPQHDDITLVAIKVVGKAARSQLPSTERAQA